MIARVSSAARVSRCGFTRRNRRTNSPLSGSVRNCQPPATSVRTMPLTPSRWMPPSCSSAASRRGRSTPVASCSWSRVTGLSVTKSRDSTTVRTRSGDRRRVRCTRRSNGSNSGGCSSISAGSTSSSSASDGAEDTDCTSASLNGTAGPERPAPSPGFSGVLTVVDLRRPALECAGLCRHPDVLRPLVLVHAEQTQLHHFEQGEEGNHHRTASALTLEQLDEGDPLARGKPGGDALHGRRERQLIPHHLVPHPGLERLEHPVQRLDEPIHAHLGERGRFDLRRGRGSDPASEHLAVEQGVFRELPGHVLVLLVLEQSAHELGPWVPLLLGRLTSVGRRL